jgi:hypothetical protein
MRATRATSNRLSAGQLTAWRCCAQILKAPARCGASRQGEHRFSPIRRRERLLWTAGLQFRRGGRDPGLCAKYSVLAASGGPAAVARGCSIFHTAHRSASIRVSLPPYGRQPIPNGSVCKADLLGTEPLATRSAARLLRATDLRSGAPANEERSAVPWLAKD